MTNGQSQSAPGPERQPAWSTPASDKPGSSIDFDYTGGIGGHPKGLNALFFTELWERFSYYGMRAILVLFMVAPVVQGGLGFSTEFASNVYGNYTMSVYLTSIPGGLIADRLLGPRKAILLGGIIIAMGHFTMAFPSTATFYAGLLLIVLGTGLLKPNISTMVGRLYSPTDVRRDAGFSIYYMSINIGAFLSPLVCGTLAQGADFRNFLIKCHIPPESSWHFGFAAAGVGMCLGLAHLLYQYKLLDKVGGRSASAPAEETTSQAAASSGAASDATASDATASDATASGAAASGVAASGAAASGAVASGTAASGAAVSGRSGGGNILTTDEWRKLAAIFLLLIFAALFWAIYEQGGSSLNLFADELTDCRIFGFAFPSSWFQALQPIYVITLAPVFSWLWIKLDNKQPSSPAKFALGLLLLGLATAIMVPAAMLCAHGKVSPIFLILVYLVQTLGELCLSPVGLSTVTKLAPLRYQAMTMGAWFVSNAMGNKLQGYLSSLIKFDSPASMVNMYGGMAGATIFAAFVLFILTPQIRKLMGSVK